MRHQIVGIHHLKFAVADLEKSLKFYESVFGAKRIHSFDHVTERGELFAIIVEFPNLGTPLELRLDPTVAAAQRGFDPITLSIESNAALDSWCDHLDDLRVPHSSVLNGLLGRLLVIEDPDGRRLRLYSQEKHAQGIIRGRDARWLG
jgi:catechol 2,3-dioxygenase-like lactoylglutathione lyase family enzyme